MRDRGGTGIIKYMRAWSSKVSTDESTLLYHRWLFFVVSFSLFSILSTRAEKITARGFSIGQRSDSTFDNEFNRIFLRSFTFFATKRKKIEMCYRRTPFQISPRYVHKCKHSHLFTREERLQAVCTQSWKAESKREKRNWNNKVFV